MNLRLLGKIFFGLNICFAVFNLLDGRTPWFNISAAVLLLMVFWNDWK